MASSSAFLRVSRSKCGKLRCVALGEIGKPEIDKSLEEFDDLGREAFLGKHGYGHATTYLLAHRGRFYDPKAVVGVAHSWTAKGGVLTRNDLDSTEAVERLRRLNYDVVSFNGLWWVNQGASYSAERAGGFVWAPKVTKSGHPASHHVAVSKLRVGQKIVHYANGAVRAIGTVLAPPEERPRPAALSGEAWGNDGYYCQVAYADVHPPIRREDVPNRSSTVGPFDLNGNVKQGYLFGISDAELFPLLEFLYERAPHLFDAASVQNRNPEPSAAESATLEPDSVFDLLQGFRNVVLEGVPGTGKTYAIERLARDWQARTGRELSQFGGQPFTTLVMHPSTSYEDFVEGLRPAADEAARDRMFDEQALSSGTFTIQDGFFVAVCARAVREPENDFLVLLDELNRCNVSSVFGDLLLTLENGRRARYMGTDGGTGAREWHASVPARLPYSGRTFFVPDNIYVVATTNTTDRSVAPLDAALRRRFAFLRLEPDMPRSEQLPSTLNSSAATLANQTSTILDEINARALGPCLGPDAMLGHSYVYALARDLDGITDESDQRDVAKRHWQFVLMPQLIDGLRSVGAEDLLSASARGGWFGDHSELLGVEQTATAALGELDRVLTSFHLTVVVEGTGLSRGARVTERGTTDSQAEEALASIL